MAKQFFYRGKTIQELKKMDLEEFIKLLPARERRTLKRGFTEEQKKLLKRIDSVLQGKSKKPIKTQCRDMIVLPKMVDLMIHIHSGNRYTQVMILPQMIGLCLGELSLTRNKVAHSAPGIGATRSSAAASVK